MTETMYLNFDASNYAERCDYERKVNTSIVAFMINNGYDIHSSEFKKKHDELVLSVVKSDVTTRIISDIVAEHGGREWTLLYKEGKLSYEK